MVYGAVTQSGGRVEVYSELGQGTSFKVYLPREAEPSRADGSEPAGLLPRGTETIVLVEDDEAVRSLASRLLVRNGYTVFAFASGPEAIDAVGQMTGPIDLLITDVVMPEMNGCVLAERITALRPTIRVLYASGYTANVIVDRGALEEGVAFLPKPYSVEAFARRVRAVLDEPAP
jgi:CheY-like chemotaxis protein